MLILQWLCPTTPNNSTIYSSPSLHNQNFFSSSAAAATATSTATAAAARRSDEMVGLSVILENQRDLCAKRSPGVISKGSIIKTPSSSSSSSSSSFLDCCFLCNQKLLPYKDIYIYQGEKAFCSVECRYRQIFMDEEQEEEEGSTSSTGYNSSLLAAIKPPHPHPQGTTSRSGVGARAPPNAFAC